MRIKSSLEIDQLKKYSDDLNQTSVTSVRDAAKALDAAQHMLSRTPFSRHDLKDALRYAKEAERELRSALRNSGKSTRISKKAIRAEKTAKKALLREEKLQIAQMKKAEPAELRETVIIPEAVEEDEVPDAVPVEKDDDGEA